METFIFVFYMNCSIGKYIKPFGLTNTMLFNKMCTGTNSLATSIPLKMSYSQNIKGMGRLEFREFLNCEHIYILKINSAQRNMSI